MAIVYARALGQVEITLESVDPASATFDNAPTEGNLLVVHAMERSGGSAANFTITDTGSNTGWIKRVAETTLPGDANVRRTHVVWTKVADATDAVQATYTITVDDGTASGKRMMMEEYTAGTSVTWTFEDVAVANTGTGSGSPLASGSTASTSGEQLLIGSTIWRTGSSTMSGVAFSGLSDLAGNVGGNNGFTVMSAWAQDATTGTKSTTISFTGGTDAEGNVALLVFSATEGGAATELDGTDTTQAQTATAAALTQIHELSADDTVQAQSATNPALTQTHELAADSATQPQSATAAALTQVHELQPTSAVQGQTATAAALEQTHELVATDAVQSQTADTAAVTEGVTLSPASAVQGQEAATAALTQVHALAAVNALQAQTADAAVLTQLHELVAASAVQGQIVVLPTITEGEIPEPAPVVLPPFRETAPGAFQESTVAAFREPSIPVYQETA